MTEKTMGERMATMEAWAKSHDERCEDRQISMGREIRELKTDVGGLTKGAWGLVIAILGFALVQLYDGMKEGRADRPPAAVAHR